MRVFVFSLFIIAVTCVATVSYAQELTIEYCEAADFSAVCGAGEDPATCKAKMDEISRHCAEFLGSPSGKWYKAWSNFLVQISDYFEEILGAIALFFAAVAAYFRTALSKLRAKIFDPLIRRAADINTLGLNVLVVGKGGSGKTSIVKALAGSDDINPNVANAVNAFYSISHEMDTLENGIVSRRVLRMYFSDHVGQDFASIHETAYFKERKLVNLPKTIIFVVDLFDTAEAYGENGLFEKIDKKRVNDHVRVYSPELLDIVTSGLDHGSKIFLFINKTDKLNLPFSKIEALCLDEFEPLIQRLRAVPGTHLVVVVGSAESGQSVMGAMGGASNLGTSILYNGLVDAAATIDR